MKKNVKQNNMSTVNRKYVLFMGNIVSYLIVSD